MHSAHLSGPAPNSPADGRTVPRLPLLTRAWYRLLAFVMQNLIWQPAILFRTWRGVPGCRPDVVKTYPCRKHLPCRIFFPPGYRAGSGQKFPTLFTLHGGGFVVGDPIDTEAWNHRFAQAHGMVVVALNYAKGPANRFPGPVHDVAALFASCLADGALPIDGGRVAMAGWSAGGTLALAAAQLEGVRARLRAIVPIYPAVDFAVKGEARFAHRRRKPALGGYREALGRSDSDITLRLAGLYTWAYSPVGHALGDPLLNPIVVERGALPGSVFVVAAEMDFLAHEAWELACRLAGKEVPAAHVPVGREQPAGVGELITDDETFAWEVRTAGGGRYRWLLVPDQVHAFDQDIDMVVRDKQLMADARIKRDKTMHAIGQWLLDGPLKG